MTTNLSKQDRPTRIRVFLAVELPAGVQAALGRYARAAGAVNETVKWIAPPLLHITMRFLGEIPADRVLQVEQAAAAAVVGVEAFDLTLGSPGVFPRERNPRVLWIGVRADAGAARLMRVQEILDDALRTRGFRLDEKSFSPHITLARARGRPGTAHSRVLSDALDQIRAALPAPGLSFTVDHIAAVRSDLGPGGPRYTPLVRVPLTAPTEPVHVF